LVLLPCLPLILLPPLLLLLLLLHGGCHCRLQHGQQLLPLLQQLG
jgi:hypothetical protein